MSEEVNVKKLQSIELEALLSIDAVCSKLGIKYFLVGGTLLGAVRHKGFIPWDDDIDIGMLRKDYEIFIDKAQKFLPQNLFVQNYKTDSEVPFNYTKIRDSRTTFIETCVKNVKMNHGVFIDVFPIDYYPENRIWGTLKNLLFVFIAQRFYSIYFFEKKLHHTFLRKIANFFLSVIFKKTKQAVVAREFIIKSGKKSKLMRNYNGAWGRREIVPAECFDDFVRLEFEGYQLMAPAAYDLYLRHIYGNYMTLPPVEKRISHHYTDKIDLENPYTNYQK
ncbi:phosphorylcholine transferase LicD [Fibrobacter succinogenes]|uniref:LicD family protein n=1 Tax=Fibrobacter succinogenes TaxID=833 RepID=UPI001567FB19|nr:LicD family protein [Fibrobacter succinogenes]